MDDRTFIAEIVGSLAWPFTVVVLVFLLRKQLRAIAPFVRRVRYGDAEVEFGSRLAEAEARAETALPIPPEAETAEVDSASAIELVELAERLAPISPRAAVTEAWARVEWALRAAAPPALASTGVGRKSVPTAFEIAKEFRDQGILSGSAFALFQDLRGLRNRAAHAIDPGITVEQAIEFARIAQRFLAYLDVASGGRSTRLQSHDSG